MDSVQIYIHDVDVDFGLERILHNITLSLEGHEHYAVLGDNGAGKTTLLRLITGELWPSQRSAGQRVYDVQGQKQPLRCWQSPICAW